MGPHGVTYWVKVATLNIIHVTAFKSVFYCQRQKPSLSLFLFRRYDRSYSGFIVRASEMALFAYTNALAIKHLWYK